MVWSNSVDRQLKERASLVIPNGMYGHESTRLLPEEYPQFFDRAKGGRLWDVDGNEYVDYLCAYGPNLLGYRHEAVEAAAAAQDARGDTLTGPSALMVELAETLVGMVDHAQWAIFCKNGTDATSIAIMAARAQTGRRKILYGKGTYHGAAAWCTPVMAGVLPEDRAHIVYYDYNDLDSLRDALKANEGDIAGVIATPFVHEVFRDQVEPDGDFARGVRQLCDEYEALLILDEVRAGFRIVRESAWAQFGVKPDLSAWGKCLANGRPLSVVLGSDTVRQGAGDIYVTGSFWFSATPMAAALATLKEVRESQYLETTIASGQRLRAGLAAQAAAHGFALRQTGPAQMPQIFFEEDPDFRVGYAFGVEALKRGAYLHPFHNMFLCGAHDFADIDQTLVSTDAAFAEIKKGLGTFEPHPIVLYLLGAHQG